MGADWASPQAAYRDLFRHVIDEDDPAAIRSSINRSGVLGIDRFQDDMEAMLNRRVEPGKAGRPRKQAKVDSNRQQMLLRPQFLRATTFTNVALIIYFEPLRES